MNTYVKKVVILAHPRSGSTSLYRILNSHPDLKLSLEPFYENYGKWNPDEKNYIDLIHDIPSFDSVLDELFCKYNGMKVLFYQLREELYTHLINRADCKVIFLWRANHLKAIVSGKIAEQTQIWQKSDFNRKSSGTYHQLKPLQMDGVDGIENNINGLKEGIRYWDEKISQKPEGSFLKVTYEELYSCGLERGLLRVKDIFDFLGLNMPEKECIVRYLEPKNEQINSMETYRFVPNINEINERFGSSENGYLF